MYVYQGNNNSGNRILPLDGPTPPSNLQACLHGGDRIGEMQLANRESCLVH
jgi:hypothetical protein